MQPHFYDFVSHDFMNNYAYPGEDLPSIPRHCGSGFQAASDAKSASLPVWAPGTHAAFPDQTLSLNRNKKGDPMFGIAFSDYLYLIFY